MADPRDTPAMQQYFRFKQEQPGCVLLFRMGDFYEMFDEDAVRVSKAIGLTLTQRSAGLPMAGVPFHQLDNYLRKLIHAGFRVAICEQLEDPAKAKGIVKRGVTRVVTPGTLVDEGLVESDSVHNLAAVYFSGEGDTSGAGLAIVDASTGEMAVLSAPAVELADHLLRRNVRELLYSATADLKPPPRVKRLLDGLQIAGTPRPAWHFRPQDAAPAVREHYGVASLAGFGLSDEDETVPAIAAVIRYLRETQTIVSGDGNRAGLSHVRPPKRDVRTSECILDAVSLRALEVERTLRTGLGGAPDRSLVGLFLGASGKGAPRTPMGRRLLRDWLSRPLADAAKIRSRQDAVGSLTEDRRLAEEIAAKLDGVQDAARIAGRLALDRATPRDLVALGRSVARCGPLLTTMDGVASLAIVRAELASVEPPLRELAGEIGAMCVDDAPPHLREGGLLRDGVDPALDEARLLQRDAGAWLASYQERLVRDHNLPNLKVGFNKVSGYYIELPTAQSRLAPASLTRKQTLKNAERYTTPELREFESKVLTAESRAFDRERELFAALCARAAAQLPAITGFSDAAAALDVTLAFADRAAARGWKRPEVVDEPVLSIHAGRHPVLEDLLGSAFVPNDMELGVEGNAAALALITGPNMAGKSTFIRQTALIVLLAHAGSFVPADRATIGVTDRIFTRIGADDALHAGQSTFMVEMTETANILHHTTARSLVVLDEIGRGTSTLDGLSLAWAIAEHLAGDLAGGRGPRTLFATHYHELTDLEERLAGRVRNLHVAVREWPGADGHPDIVFLHRIEPGRADQSYGIHVARLAGLPVGVIDRAREVLSSLAVQHGPATVTASAAPAGQARAGQMSLFTEYLEHPAIDQLRELKIEAMSPMQAFDALRRLKEEAGRAS
jgi:DNA mismatch repair protein MutS